MKKLLLGLFLLPLLAHAHGDEPHADEHKAPAGADHFTVYSASQRYELVLNYPEIVAGRPTELTLYLADYATNRPLPDVDIKVATQEDPNLTLTVEAHEPGVYHLSGTFPQARAYALTVALQSATHGADLQLLRSVEVGRKLPVPETAAPAAGGFPLTAVLTFVAGLLAGLLGMFFFKKRPRTATLLLVAVAWPLFLQRAAAHGDEPHGEKTKTGATGTDIFIPKETQFLFNVLTQPMGSGDFSPAIALYGTVVPAPSGFADIIAPQNAQVTSLKVQPGQRVGAGQIVAILKPSGNQSEQVSIALETGRLNTDIRLAQSEVEAAQREVNRLRPIADVAAKKDVQAAEARLNAATAQLTALQKIAGGSAAAAGGSIVLRSPVAGIVGPFALAPGVELPAGTSLFTVTDLTKVYVEAQVYDRDAELVRDAGKFSVTCSNDDHKTAAVRLVSAAQAVNPTNQSQRVLFELANPAGEFKIGEFVTLQAFQRTTERQLFVPNSALSEINGKPVVFLKETPEHYAVSYVSLGEDNGTHTVVLKGVEAGERLVTAGTYQVKMMLLDQ